MAGASWCGSPRAASTRWPGRPSIFEDLRAQWASTLGTGRLRELEDSLRVMAPQGSFRLDVPGWFGA